MSTAGVQATSSREEALLERMGLGDLKNLESAEGAGVRDLFPDEPPATTAPSIALVAPKPFAQNDPKAALRDTVTSVQHGNSVESVAAAGTRHVQVPKQPLQPGEVLEAAPWSAKRAPPAEGPATSAWAGAPPASPAPGWLHLTNLRVLWEPEHVDVRASIDAPTLEAVSDTKIRVFFAVPPDCKYASVRFYEDEAKHGRNVAQDTCTLRKVGETGPSFSVRGTSRSILVKGLSPTVTYRAVVIAGNYVGFGPSSPVSRPMKLADYRPPAPCVPALSKITSDTVRVRFSLSPDCTAARVQFKNRGVVQGVDGGSGNKLAPHGSVLSAILGDQGFVVPGLLPDTEYEVRVSAHSKFGWSPCSPWVKFRTLKDGDVEITGTRTQAERDAEAKKRAVDVDAEDDGEPERVEKRAKPER